jgi:hypothetical protein
MIRLPLVVFTFAVLLTQVASAVDTRADETRVGTVQSGSYVTISEQLENTGSLPIFVFATAVDGAAFDFNCPNLPLELKPHSKLSRNVGFRPQHPVKYAGKIIVWFKWRAQDDSDEEPQDDQTRAGSFHHRERWKWEERDVHLVAVAAPLAGTISLSPSSITFDPVQVAHSTTITEILGNRGRAPLTVLKIAARGAGFSFSENPPLTLSPEPTVRFVRNYAPGSSALSRGSLALESNASNPELSLKLAGTAFLPGELRVSSAAIDFGDVAVGSAQKQVETLFAAGGPVRISSATVNNAEFAMSGISLPITIPAGRTASLILAFRPQSPGTATDALTLVSAINSSADVPIAGTGTQSVQHSVSLSWDPSTSADVIGYNLYRGAQSGEPYSLSTPIRTATHLRLTIMYLRDKLTTML